MMEHISHFINNYGIIAFFIIMFLDSLFLPIPSQSLLILTSLSAVNGKISLPTILLSCFIGTMCGSCFVYWVGRQGGHTILIKIYTLLKIKPERAQKFETLLDQKGTYFILVARFIVGIRRVYALILGSFHMNFYKFLFANCIGAVIWLFAFGVCPYMITQLLVILHS